MSHTTGLKTPLATHPRLLNLTTAAAYLGMTEWALRSRIRQLQVPFRKIGGRIVFLKDELDDMIVNLPGVTLQEVEVQRERMDSMTGEHDILFSAGQRFTRKRTSREGKQKVL